MSNLRSFPLQTVLTVTTGRLLTRPSDDGRNGIRDLYKILKHMTGEDVWTHQLGRFCKECKPWLYRWFPELATAETGLAKLNDWLKASPTCPDEGVKMWLAELKMLDPRIQDEYLIGQIPQDDHTYKDPYDELVEIRGTDEGIVLMAQEGNIDAGT